MYSKAFIRGVVIMGVVVTVVVGLPMALVVLASQPWNTVPSTAEAVGVWQVGSTDERMTLYPSHKIVFSNIPRRVVEDYGSHKDDKTPRITTTGRWSDFSNAEGYGPSSYYSYRDKSGDDNEGGELDSLGFGSGRVLILDYVGSELDFHRISATL